MFSELEADPESARFVRTFLRPLLASVRLDSDDPREALRCLAETYRSLPNTVLKKALQGGEIGNRHSKITPAVIGKALKWAKASDVASRVWEAPPSPAKPPVWFMAGPGHPLYERAREMHPERDWGPGMGVRVTREIIQRDMPDLVATLETAKPCN